MGYTIGMPSMKLSNVQSKGASKKHCGNFKKVVSESLTERQGKDIDIDKTKSYLNEYVGFKTARELIEYSERHIAELNERRAAAGERKIREDAVVMCATVFKPPMEMMAEFTHALQKHFLQDCAEIFGDIVGVDNIKSIAFHFDELNSHIHIDWEPITADGRLCAKEMHNLKFFSKLNKEMPKKLRERGWTMVDDCKMYDELEADTKKAEMGDEEYKAYTKKRQENNGRSSGAFKWEMDKKAAELQKLITDMHNQMLILNKLKEDKERQLSRLEEQIENNIDYDKELAKNIKKEELELNSLYENIDTLDTNISDLTKLANEWTAFVDDLRIEADDLKQERAERIAAIQQTSKEWLQRTNGIFEQANEAFFKAKAEMPKITVATKKTPQKGYDER